METDHELCSQDSTHFCEIDHHSCSLCEEYLSDTEEPQHTTSLGIAVYYKQVNLELEAYVLGKCTVRTSDRAPPLA